MISIPVNSLICPSTAFGFRCLMSCHQTTDGLNLQDAINLSSSKHSALTDEIVDNVAGVTVNSNCRFERRLNRRDEIA